MFSFPYDTQDCALDIGNVLEPAEIVNITNSTSQVDMQSFYSSSEFEVDALEITRLTFEVSMCFAYIISLYPTSHCTNN